MSDTTQPATPAVTTSPATPVAPTTTAPAQPPTTTAVPDDSASAVVYEDSGNASLDVALSFLGRLGFGPDTPEMQGVQAGNFALLEAKLGTLGAKAEGWQQIVALGKAAYQEVIGAQQATAASIADAQTKAAGSPEAWAQVQAWVDGSADAADKAAISTAMNAGGIAARAMAMYLQYGFSQTQGKQPTAPPGMFKPGPRAPAQAGNASGALSPRAYVAEVAALRQKLGSRMDSSAEYAALGQRRAAWRG